VTSSVSAAARASASPPAVSPWANITQARAASRLMLATRDQYGSLAAAICAAIESSASPTHPSARAAVDPRFEPRRWRE